MAPFRSSRLTALVLAGSLCALSGAACVRAAPAPGSDIQLLNRLTWGVNGDAVRTLAREGEGRYLDEQLRPPPGDRLPPEAQALINAMEISRVPMDRLVPQLQQERLKAVGLADANQKKAAKDAYHKHLQGLVREAEMRSLLRDIYSPDQLREQTSWFWLNHFNIFQHTLGGMLADYEDNAIRAHALGKFRDLLSATVHHPAMLFYLNNDKNAAGKINENYARELMELHTLGVGSGYTQKDVQELARILTGVGINLTDKPRDNIKPERANQYVHDGLFEFNPNRHDYGDKVFLGHTIKGRGLAEVDEVVDILARAPATSKFISRKLAVYYVSDNPPQALVDRMADTFRKTDGDIAAVLKTMVQSPEFRASLGHKFKDPMHYTVSAVRVAYPARVITNPDPLLHGLGAMAERLYGHQTPDGYPMTEAAWSNSGGMSARFEFAKFIGQDSRPLMRASRQGAGAGGGGERAELPNLAKDAGVQGLLQTASPTTKAALAKAASPGEWNTLFLSSPEFMRR